MPIFYDAYMVNNNKNKMHLFVGEGGGEVVAWGRGCGLAGRYQHQQQQRPEEGQDWQEVGEWPHFAGNQMQNSISLNIWVFPFYCVYFHTELSFNS